ncbi:YjcQ family protein [Lactococcus lactis]|uniref:YjcQ family protein n=1 Tax=Lactococcus lactis TaxID=1358 RepID=UPI0019138A19|nr:YjcQ family protein [Lactococcus lactis]MBK5077083.1 YjcQ family protein [Lactococcus lactis]
MAKDDFFYISYKILAYLYHAMKKGEKIDPGVFDPQNYRVSYPYLNDILEELKENGYIKGISFIETKDGKLINGLSDIKITIKGIEYLDENSMMKKAYKTLKELKDWIPGT